MAIQNLHNLVLRAASLAGVRTTSQERKALFMAVVGNPARALSLPWQPLPGLYPIRTGPESTGGYRSRLHRACSMRPMATDTLGGRAGRSAGCAGALGQARLARLADATILSGWSVTQPVVAKRIGG
jgi:hypothetical protein